MYLFLNSKISLEIITFLYDISYLCVAIYHLETFLATSVYHYILVTYECIQHHKLSPKFDLRKTEIRSFTQSSSVKAQL
jgi:hypothetical protein